MLASLRQKRAEIEVNRLRSQESTYAQAIHVDSGDEREFAEVKKFLSDFYRTIYQRREELQLILERNPQVNAHYQNLVNGGIVTYEDFWQRYFYRCDKERIKRQWERQAEEARHKRAEQIHSGLQSMQHLFSSTGEVLNANTPKEPKSATDAALASRPSSAAASVRQKVSAILPPGTSRRERDSQVAAPSQNVEKGTVAFGESDQSVVTPIKDVSKKMAWKEAEGEKMVEQPKKNSTASDTTTSLETSEKETEATFKMLEILNTATSEESNDTVSASLPAPPNIREKISAVLASEKSSREGDTQLVSPSQRTEEEIAIFDKNATASSFVNPIKEDSKRSEGLKTVERHKNKSMVSDTSTSHKISEKEAEVAPTRKETPVFLDWNHGSASATSKTSAAVAEQLVKTTSKQETCTTTKSSRTGMNLKVLVAVLPCLLLLLMGMLLQISAVGDFLCAPVRPGTLIQDNFEMTLAPWWLPTTSSTAFELLCGERNQSRIQMRNYKDGGGNFRVFVKNQVVLNQRHVSSVLIQTNQMVIESKQRRNTLQERVRAPWALTIE